MYVLVLLLVDVAYAFIDPRIKASYLSHKRKSKKIRKSLGDIEAAEPAPPLTEQTTILASDAETAVALHVSDFAEQDEAIPEYEVEQVIEHHEPEPVTPESTVCAYAATDNATEADTYSGIESDEFLSEPASSLDSSATPDNVADVILTRKYKKNRRGVEVFRHLLRNPGATAGLIIIFLVMVGFVASMFISFEAMSSPSIPDRFSPPSARFPFGTDNMGRCSFTRTIYATRFSFPIGIGATAIGALIGVFLGSLAAFKEGSIGEEVIMRFSDALASIPGILIGMVIILSLGQSLPNLMLAIGVNSIPGFIRISRASILSVKGNEFVEAAKATGFSETRTLYTEVLPNGLAPIIITFTGAMGTAILVSAGLSFLGFGIPMPYPEWGSLVSAGRDHINTAPWLTLFPGMFIVITVMGFNLLGDGLRDAFDPKLKR
jgi:peptide/nickel transport system permease protein